MVKKRRKRRIRKNKRKDRGKEEKAMHRET